MDKIAENDVQEFNYMANDIPIFNAAQVQPHFILTSENFFYAQNINVC